MGETDIEHKTSNASLRMEFKLRDECEEPVEGALRKGRKIEGEAFNILGTQKGLMSTILKPMKQVEERK